MFDLRKVLELPLIYKSFQTLVGANRLRKELVEQYIRPEPHWRVLDIGCGTADIRPLLGDVSYAGFDPSPAYIERAQREHPESTFFVGSVTAPPLFNEQFDLVLAIGVLHHVDDDTGLELFHFASENLAPLGRVVSVDPVLVENSKSLANAVVSKDRGQHVRFEREYLALAQAAFPGSARSETRSGLINLPYNHCIMSAQLD